ncbi:hypothetical protein SAMN05216224_10815 [Thioclava dalianensis]|nr:hypothetical protein [Thioclava dalianensis]SFN61708.1 hypothetical protein SAMN05216224_10815 [Thioclava dalianensis]
MLVSLVQQRKLERQARDARRGKLGRGRYDNLVKELVDVIQLAFEAGATGSLWGLEGPLRAGLRSDLCLQGWGWDSADLIAREILAEAFRAAGAKRPTWNEGQPEWTIHEGLLIERTRCIRCGKPLPEGHKKYCSGLCASTHQSRIDALKNLQVNNAVRSMVGIRST